MPTAFRGPLQYYSTGGVPSPVASSQIGAPQPFLSGAPIEAVDGLPRLSTNMPDEGPRCFGYAFHALSYPGPYTEAQGSLTGLSVTSPGAGVGTGGVSDNSQLGGKLRLQNSATTDNGNAYLGSTAGSYLVVAGKRIFFAVTLSNPNSSQTAGEIFAGLSATTFAADLATPPTDGVFFLKADGSTDFNFHVRNTGVSTQVTNVFAKAGVALMTVNTVFELGFLIDDNNSPSSNAAGPISCYVNGRLAGAVTSNDPNIPGALTALSLCLGRQNGSNAIAAGIDIFQCLCLEEL